MLTCSVEVQGRRDNLAAQIIPVELHRWLRVLVSENLAFHAEYTPILAKHSKETLTPLQCLPLGSAFRRYRVRHIKVAQAKLVAPGLLQSQPGSLCCGCVAG